MATSFSCDTFFGGGGGGEGKGSRFKFKVKCSIQSYITFRVIGPVPVSKEKKKINKFWELIISLLRYKRQIVIVLYFLFDKIFYRPKKDHVADGTFCVMVSVRVPN